MIYIVVKNKVIDRSDFATVDITSWDEIIFASTDKTEAVTAAGKAAYKMFPQPANGHAILRWSSTPNDFARQDWVVLLELHEGSKIHVLCRPVDRIHASM